MEACIEAFPQSILQMVSIVVYHEHTTLNVVSVVISMTAVASKSVMLSYNIDRRVFYLILHVLWVIYSMYLQRSPGYFIRKINQIILKIP
eukprot:UN30201